MKIKTQKFDQTDCEKIENIKLQIPEGDILKDPADIKNLLKEYCECFNNKFHHLEIPWKSKLSKFNHKVDNLNCSIHWINWIYS